MTLKTQRNFTPVGSGDPVGAKWVRLDTNQPPDGDNQFLLAPGETATLAASGTFRTPGTWEVVVEVVGSGPAATRRIVLAVTRTPPPAIPSTLLAEPRTARVTLRPLEFGTPLGLEVRLEARNQGTQPLRLKNATVGQVSTTSDPAEVSSSTAKFTISKSDCGSDLRAGATCRIALGIPSDLRPGRYVAEVVLPGEGGGESVRSQTVEVRRSAWTAGFTCAFGALLGALVSTWRSTGRIRVEARILAAERRRRVSEIMAAATLQPAKDALASLRERLEDLDGSIRRGLLPPDFSPHDARLQAIIGALDAYGAIDLNSPEQEAALGSPVKNLQTALENAAREQGLKEDVTKGIADAAGKLRLEAAEFQTLRENALSADKALAALGPRLLTLLQGTALANAWHALWEAREHAFPQPGAETDGKTLLQRTAEIQSLTAALNEAAAADAVPKDILERLKERAARNPAPYAPLVKEAEELAVLWRRLPSRQRMEQANHVARTPEGVAEGAAEAGQQSPVASIPVVVPPGSGLTLDFDSLLSGPVRLAALSELERLKSAWDMLANAAVLLGIGAAAVPLLWVGNPIWGAPSDIVTALLAGMGTRLAVGSAARP
ncbi:hypothetical protein E0493_21985 [Roseomonas sp. M0104]|uniref:Uncharacterized protein n=1 Tax=Teichococcus coralli TaxID=2545983 RepID=A0A845BGK3_9PROT|nr:hypothetical protein [Pseudoroseomonas coralli]MXP66018.1 hypothetical protein [Pseudoroseomonas coralli]